MNTIRQLEKSHATPATTAAANDASLLHSRTLKRKKNKREVGGWSKGSGGEGLAFANKIK
jgi:hypothetical protein